MATSMEFLKGSDSDIRGNAYWRWTKYIKTWLFWKSLKLGAVVNAVAARYRLRMYHLSEWRSQVHCRNRVGDLIILMIFDLLMHQFIRAFAFGLQLRDGNPVGWCFISVDDTWLSSVFQAIQSLPQEALGCFGVARRRQVEIDRVAEFVDDSVKVSPLSRDLHISFINPPTRGERERRRQPWRKEHRLDPQHWIV